jgi:hypothetical protein
MIAAVMIRCVKYVSTHVSQFVLISKTKPAHITNVLDHELLKLKKCLSVLQTAKK